MQCAWCPALNRCSTHTGNDRRKQDWMQKGKASPHIALPLTLSHTHSHFIFPGCERTFVSTSDRCPALGNKGNNAASQDNNGASYSNNNKSNADNAGGTTSPMPATNSAAGSNAGSANGGVTESTLSSTQSPTSAAVSSDHRNIEKSEHLDAVHTADNKNVGVAFGFMVPICLVFAITLWLFYAYRNPHTRSGQLLIQVRATMKKKNTKLSLIGITTLKHLQCSRCIGTMQKS